MNIEEAAMSLMKNVGEKLKETIRNEVEIVLSEAYCNVFPYVEYDTMSNVQVKCQSIIDQCIKGEFNIIADNIVEVTNPMDSITVRIEMTSFEWDKIRESLLKIMPACPKDLEIKSLKDQLKRASEYYNNF